MSEPKFTDGPWFKKGKRVFWQKPDRSLPEDNLFNGLVCICATTEDDPPEVMEEANANASLIAQCTTMYQSLEDDMKFFRETADWLKEQFGDTAIVAVMFMRADEIEKLLSRARGEEGAGSGKRGGRRSNIGGRQPSHNGDRLKQRRKR